MQSATKDTKAEMLASYMMEGFGSVPIVDDNKKLVGIVSEFDLLSALRKGKKLEDVTAGDILTANPVSVTKDTDVMTLVDVLQNNHLIRVPVLDNVRQPYWHCRSPRLCYGAIYKHRGVEAPRGVMLLLFLTVFVPPIF